MADISPERKFLHDIATPLGTSLFLIDSLVEDLRDKLGPDSQEVARASEVYKALQAMQKLLQDRRELLIKNG